MPRFIASPCNPKYPAQEHELRAMFGVTGGKWPKQGCPARCIQGIWVHVLPSDHESLTHPLRPGKAKRAQHRCIASCPECGTGVSAGRLAQHRCDARVNKAERLRRYEFSKTLAETRAKADEAQRRFEHGGPDESDKLPYADDGSDIEFPEGRIDSQSLKTLGDDE